MSTYYSIHTEVRIGGAWHCVDPLILHLKTEHSEQEYALAPTYENGSRSYFGRTADKLENMSGRFCFDDLSEELKDYYMKWRLPPEEIPEEVTHCSCCVSVESIREAVQSLKGKSRHAIVHKDSIAAFESGESDDIYNEIDPGDYSKLDEEAKKVYQYYEWDDPMEWECHFREILKRINRNISAFADVNYRDEITDARIILTIT